MTLRDRRKSLPFARSTRCSGSNMGVNMGRYWLGAAVVLLALAPAQAAADAFTSCDGYAAPDAREDGLIRLAVPLSTVFGQPSSPNAAQPLAQAASGGIEACTSALADPRLPSNLLARRASLLRARAMHRLVQGDDMAALVDIDAAEAVTAGHEGLLYRRSMIVGTHLLRAYVALRQHQRERAIALAEQVVQERPYVLSTALVAAQIRMQASGDLDRYFADLRRIATFYPAVLNRLFAIYGDLRRWDDQIALRPRIVSINPGRVGGFQPTDAAALPGRRANEEMLLDTATALALAMSGRDAEAAALLDGVEARLAVIDHPMPPASPAEIAGHDRMVASTRPAAEAAVQARQIIAALPLARAGNVAGVAAAGRAGRLPDGAESLSLVELAVARSRAPDADMVRTLRDLQERRRRAILDQRLTPPEVFAAMPEAESIRRIPPYAEVRGRNGYVVRPGDTPGRYLINFGGNTASPGIVQDLVLLRAADLARSTGRHGFVVVTNRSFSRTLNVNDIVVRRIVPAGYAAEAEVVLVDSAHPPGDIADLPSRMVDADRVHADLAPVYLQTAAAQ